MKILFFGDIVGRLGLEAVASLLPKLAKEYEADFIIANGENVSRGKGITERDYLDLIDAGVDCVTLGNHWNSKKQIEDYIEDADRLIRPLNLLNFDKGVGSAVFDCDGVSIRVTNLLGTAFMKEDVRVPYIALREVLDHEEKADIHIVDYHAESTSEKQLFGHLFDGQVSAVIGTHTHVQTNDARIFPKGTGFLSDAGMCGADDSIIGFNVEGAIDKMIYGKDNKLSLDEDAKPVVCFVWMEFDDETGACRFIRPVQYIGGNEFYGEASI
jgi:metallophosphoesterase (TIGR00282 family)